ncbi:unnamed protein product, partial [Polarella glacialis]
EGRPPPASASAAGPPLSSRGSELAVIAAAPSPSQGAPLASRWEDHESRTGGRPVQNAAGSGLGRDDTESRLAVREEKPPRPRRSNAISMEPDRREDEDGRGNWERHKAREAELQNRGGRQTNNERRRDKRRETKTNVSVKVSSTDRHGAEKGREKDQAHRSTREGGKSRRSRSGGRRRRPNPKTRQDRRENRRERERGSSRGDRRGDRHDKHREGGGGGGGGGRSRSRSRRRKAGGGGLRLVARKDTGGRDDEKPKREGGGRGDAPEEASRPQQQKHADALQNAKQMLQGLEALKHRKEAPVSASVGGLDESRHRRDGEGHGQSRRNPENGARRRKRRRSAHSDDARRQDHRMPSEHRRRPDDGFAGADAAAPRPKSAPAAPPAAAASTLNPYVDVPVNPYVDREAMPKASPPAASPWQRRNELLRREAQDGAAAEHPEGNFDSAGSDSMEDEESESVSEDGEAESAAPMGRYVEEALHARGQGPSSEKQPATAQSQQDSEDSGSSCSGSASGSYSRSPSRAGAGSRATGGSLAAESRAAGGLPMLALPPVPAVSSAGAKPAAQQGASAARRSASRSRRRRRSPGAAADARGGRDSHSARPPAAPDHAAAAAAWAAHGWGYPQGHPAAAWSAAMMGASGAPPGTWAAGGPSWPSASPYAMHPAYAASAWGQQQVHGHHAPQQSQQPRRGGGKGHDNDRDSRGTLQGHQRPLDYDRARSDFRPERHGKGGGKQSSQRGSSQDRSDRARGSSRPRDSNREGGAASTSGAGDGAGPKAPPSEAKAGVCKTRTTRAIATIIITTAKQQ